MIDLATISRITGNRLGTFDVPCPDCGPFKRSAANQRKKVLRVYRIEPHFAGYFCARCGAKGAALDRDGPPPDPDKLAKTRAEAKERDRALKVERLRDDEAGRIARARQIWEGARNAVGSPAARYLASRSITLPSPPTLRWAARCWHAEARRELPAMVALVEHAERGFVGVHRTYLCADGSGKADLPKDQQKRTLGPIRGGAVRLGAPRPGEWLAIGEGIETTLTVMTACGLPGWAGISAGGIASLILPPAATHVVVCADHDGHGVGQRAAEDAAARWLAEGRRVRIATPPEPNSDFNDLLMAEAATAEARRVA